MNNGSDQQRKKNTDGKCPITRFFRTLHMIIFVPTVIFLTIVLATLTFTSVVFSRKFARKVGRTWNRLVLGIGGVRVKAIGLDKLDKCERYVFMANHQSALDIPIIYVGIGEQISFIAKKELFAIPIFGWGMSAVGHVSIDRGNPRKAHASIANAVEKLNREKVSLILFPEGTRSKDGKVHEFKTAAFSLALKTGVKLVPVAIKGAIDCLPPKTNRIVPGEVILEIGTPISVEELKNLNKTEISDRVYKEIKEMVEGCEKK